MKNFIKHLLFLCLPVLAAHGQSSENTIIITGEFVKGIEVKEMTLNYWENMVSYAAMAFTPYQKEVSPVRNGKFHFKIHPERGSVYIKLGWKHDKYGFIDDPLVHYLYMAKAGDSINLKIDSVADGYHIRAEGKGAVAYNAIMEQSRCFLGLQRQWYDRHRGQYDPDDYRSWSIKRGKDASNFLVEERLTLLTKHKKKLDSYVYEVYKTDILSEQYYNYCLGLAKRFQNAPADVSEDILKSDIGQALTDLEAIVMQFQTTVDARVLAASAYYGNLLSAIAELRSRLKGVLVVKVLPEWASRVQREKALATYCLFRANGLDSKTKEALLRESLIAIQDPYIRSIITDHLQGSKVGAEVYDFSLPDTQGNLVSLSDFRGRVVFIDFWYAGCGGCARYYRKVVRHVEKIYEGDPDVAFITVSIDADKKRWIEYIKKGTYTSEKIINLHCPDGLRNPVIQQFSVKGYPHPLLIDRKGRVFNDSAKDLRLDGVDGLVTMIAEAKKEK